MVFNMKKIFFISLICFFMVSCSSINELVGVIDNPISKKIAKGVITERFDSEYETDSEILETVIKTADNVKKVSEDEILPEEAYYIGRTVAAKITESYQLYEETEVVEYLNKICKAITINSPVPYLYKDYCVAILDSDEINALATPGGHIFVTRGILQNTNSEDTIAAILAHEISHIQLNHSLNAIKSSRVTTAVLEGVNDVQKVTRDNVKESLGNKIGIDIDLENEFNFIKNAGDEIIHTLVDSGFSVVQEFDADSNALLLLQGAGYDPSAMDDVLTLLENNLDDKSSGWSKTHPSPSARRHNLKVYLKDMKFKGSNKNNRLNRYNLIKISF